MRTNRLRRMVLLALILGVVAGPVSATQILISPGQRWDDLPQRVKPGDEIILMPGVHRAVQIEGLVGTKEQPITIRGLDSSNLAQIEGNVFGLRLLRSRHVILQNLLVRGAEINGIFISGTRDTLPADDAAPEEAYGDITLINVRVLNTGQYKKRHALELVGLKNVSIKECHIEGWSGSGIEIVACSGIDIDASTFKGLEDFGQQSGVRIRAGSENINVTNCRFENAGMTALCIGSASPLKEFPKAIINDAKIASIFEARRVKVEKNLFIGGSCSLTMTHCDRVEIHRNTIIRPEHFVFCLLQTQDDDLIGATRRCTIGMNIITWTPTALDQFFLIDEGVDLVTIKIETNLWWSTESAESRKRLGDMPQLNVTAQKFEVDPKLDGEYIPSALAANGYGARPIRIAQPQDDQNP